MMGELYLNSQRVDWLTLTTFDLGEFSRAKALVWDDWLRECEAYNRVIGKGQTAVVPKQEKSKFLQYRGVSMNGVFFGSARQGKNEHFVVRVSGDRAHWVAQNARQYALLGMNCTRIDIQVTVPQPPTYSARELEEVLERVKRERGIRFKVQTITNSDGMDTVYLGSRTSQKFLRVYVKEANDAMRALRLEIEYKGAMAKGVWAMVNHIGASQVCVREIGASVARLPAEVTMGGGHLHEFLKFSGDRGLGVVHRPEKITDMSSRARWLNNQVYSSWVKLFNSHEGRDDAIAFLMRLNEVAGYEGNKSGLDASDVGGNGLGSGGVRGVQATLSMD